MPLVQPGLLRLAQRLRDLREQQWPDIVLTQAALAKALSSEGHLSSATVSSWENSGSPKLPPRSRLTAYARFFATYRPVEEDPPRLPSLDALTDDERGSCEALEAELLALRDGARSPQQKMRSR